MAKSVTEQVEVDAEGRILRVLDRTASVPGKNLRLTLDVSLQRVAMDALKGERGAIVAIDPRNGEVMALVSNPGFNANMFVDGIRPAIYNALRESPDRPLFNRALMGRYPPGSTIKPFIGLAGLASGMRDVRDTTWCPGWFSLPGSSHRYRCWKEHGHGQMDLSSAIVQSCDVYFYELAHDLGIDRMHDFLTRFGFGSKTGIEIGPESSGNVPSREWKQRTYGRPWYPGETVITGIGQGALLTTPLQLASATATLANDGTVMTPHLLREVSDPISGKVVNAYQNNSRQLAIGKDTHWQKIQQTMRDVVHGERGTARRSGVNAEYEMAGKTGTAQVVGIAQGERYQGELLVKEHRDHALFVAYAPVDAPRIALSIIVENGGSGSATAAPIARKLLDHVLVEGSN
ncbi:MAG: penicillin-binding protein 2 [Gammaproteobacteria bacterium]|nr:penicillin-binding protein 2 [Gammaproteobacteria bacterium]